MNVLIVDDEPLARERLRYLIGGMESFQALEQEASSGRMAIELCDQYQPDIVLMDIRMPGINGAELLMLMAAEGIEIPVIVMAGFPDFDEEEMKQFPNVRKLFHKPLYPEDVLNAVREFAGPPQSKLASE